MADFMIAALLAGIGVALVAGPLGCFIVWRRMAYFGDTLAHSALLGVVLGFLLEVDFNLAIACVCVSVALAMVLLQRQRQLASDTLLGILAHSSLSVGLVVISFVDDLQVDLTGFLFGDLLAVDTRDLLWIYGGGVCTLVALAVLWRPLLRITLHEELAKVEGIPVEGLRLTLMLLISLVIAIAMKIVGVLLITSMLIIPAATARRFTRTPETMAVGASLIGIFAVVLGLTLSYYQNTPAGPSVVTSAFAIFVMVYLLRSKSSAA